MPGIRSPDFYDLCSFRPYPVDDASTLLDDNGNFLPFDVVVDLNAVFPDTAGQFAWISALSVSPRLVTVVIQAAFNAAASPAGVRLGIDPGFAPLLAITLPRSQIVPYRQYPLEPQYPGAGGWIVFGNGIANTTPYYGKFSTPKQAMLLPSCCQKRKPLPVQGVGKLSNASPLTGLVLLKGGPDIQIVAEPREINNQLVNAIVIRLADTTSPQQDRNVFDLYTGPCGGRPESGTCGDPQPVEFLGPVGPDCCGNVTLEFRGCAEVAQILGQCGVVLDCNFGLSQACGKTDVLPTAGGILPNEYADQCAGFSVVSMSLHPASLHGLNITSLLCVSSELVPSLLPHWETFDSGTAAGFVIEQGAFDFVVDDSPEAPASNLAVGKSWRTTDTSQLNLAVWQVSDPHWTSENKAVDIGLKLKLGADGDLHNGAIVFNHRVTSQTTPPLQDYWVAEVNWDGYYVGGKILRIAHVVQNNYTTYASVEVPDLALNAWYHLTLTIQRIKIGGVNYRRFTATLLAAGAAQPSAVVQYDEPAAAYTPDTGMFGVQSLRGVTEFSWFRVGNYCQGDALWPRLIRVQDHLAGVDVLQIGKTWAVAIVDNLAGADQFTRQQNFAVAVADNLGLANTYQYARIGGLISLHIADNLGFNTPYVDVTPGQLWLVHVQDSLAGADTPTVSYGAHIWSIHIVDMLAPSDMYDIPGEVVRVHIQKLQGVIFGGGELNTVATGNLPWGQVANLTSLSQIQEDTTAGPPQGAPQILNVWGDGANGGLGQGVLQNARGWMGGAGLPYSHGYFTNGREADPNNAPGGSRASVATDRIAFTLSSATDTVISAATNALVPRVAPGGLSDGQTQAYFTGGLLQADLGLTPVTELRNFATDTPSAAPSALLSGLFISGVSGTSSHGYAGFGYDVLNPANESPLNRVNYATGVSLTLEYFAFFGATGISGAAQGAFISGMNVASQVAGNPPYVELYQVVDELNLIDYATDTTSAAGTSGIQLDNARLWNMAAGNWQDRSSLAGGWGQYADHNLNPFNPTNTVAPVASSWIWQAVILASGSLVISAFLDQLAAGPHTGPGYIRGLAGLSLTRT